MISHPLIGVLFHWLGGFSCACFYIPYRGVRKWSWETYWLVGGIFSWLVAPWIFALVMTSDLLAVLHETPWSTLGWTYFFGALWGLGGLTFGLTMRYLGISLGMAVALSYCAAFGTLMPPLFHPSLFHNDFAAKILDTTSGLVILSGVVICLVGIGFCGLAGMTKEREMTAVEKKSVIKEFNFKKGILVATFSGVMSASFSYGLNAGASMKAISASHGTGELWQGLDVLVVVLLGGFTTNFIWCLFLHWKNRTGGQYIARDEIRSRADEYPHLETAIEAPAEEMALQAKIEMPAQATVPLGVNYLLCAIAGVAWYLQFFFYTIGESQMGQYKFSSWSIHMASIIIFSTLLGLALHEWRGASRRAMSLLTLSLVILVGSTVIIGFGNYLAAAHESKTETAATKP
jgi:L-rhamnose-H+ transport protein